MNQPAPTSFRFELKRLLILMLPILTTQVAQSAFGLIDTIMAGRLSAADLASIAVAVSIWIPLMLFCNGIILAVSPLISEAVGASEHKKIVNISHQALWIAGALGIVAMLLLQCVPLLFDTLKIPENLHAKAGLFLHSVAFGLPAAVIYSVLRCYCEALGRPHIVTLISLGAIPVLIPLNYIFMYGMAGLPAMGSAGAGVANAILQWLMLFALLIYIKRASHFTLFRLLEQIEKPDLAMMKRILWLGLPIGFAIFFEVSLFSTAALVVSPLGDITLAAHQITLSITSQLFMIPLALSMALTICVGQYFGAENWQAMRQAQKAGFAVATLFSCITMLFLWIYRGEIIHLYNNNPNVYHIAFGLTLFAVAYQIIDAWQVAAAGCLRGMQDTKIPMIFTFIAYWIVAFPLGLYLTHYVLHSASGVWVGLIVGLSVACVLLLWRIFIINKKIIHQNHAN